MITKELYSKYANALRMIPQELPRGSTPNRGRWIVAFRRRDGAVGGYRFSKRSEARAFARLVRGRFMRFRKRRWRTAPSVWEVTWDAIPMMAWAIAKAIPSEQPEVQP